MYKGDTRTRTMDVYVDGVVQTTWTSSGTTTGFENIELGVSGHAVELRGVLADSEWLSILEVCVNRLQKGRTFVDTPAGWLTPHHVVFSGGTSSTLGVHAATVWIADVVGCGLNFGGTTPSRHPPAMSVHGMKAFGLDYVPESELEVILTKSRTVESHNL